MKLSTVEKVRCLLEENTQMVLVSVIRRSGSTPAPLHGTLVVYHGSSDGTVGGGALEGEALKEANRLLETGRSALLTVTMTSTQAADEGMLCGGEATLLLEFIDHRNSGAWLDAGKCLLSGTAGLFVIRAIGKGYAASVTREWFSVPDFHRLGTLAEKATETISKDAPATLDNPEGVTLLDPINVPNDLLIFGAGHLSKALVPLASSVGFRCWVIDDRELFASRDRFPDAYKLVVEAPASAVPVLPSGPNVWAVIVTRGHKDDAQVLGRLLKDGHRYIGMVGSTRKKRIIWESLMAQGVDQETLGRIHCPIGLPIGGTSPEEIALSIVAELIAVKYGTRDGIKQPCRQLHSMNDF